MNNFEEIKSVPISKHIKETDIPLCFECPKCGSNQLKIKEGLLSHPLGIKPKTKYSVSSVDQCESVWIIIFCECGHENLITIEQTNRNVEICLNDSV